MADSRFVPSQWETSLQSNTISHWLGANLESALMQHLPVWRWDTVCVVIKARNNINILPKPAGFRKEALGPSVIMTSPASWGLTYFNTLRSEQNGQHFRRWQFELHFVKNKIAIWFKFHFWFVPMPVRVWLATSQLWLRVNRKISF